MFKTFQYMPVPLEKIYLDYQNPRIVTQQKLASQEAIVAYLFEYEKLGEFVRKIAIEGKNIGPERPYIVKTGNHYTVVEGNTRIATYKLLLGMMAAPEKHTNTIPVISKAASESYCTVDCSIAPSRDALLPIMANSHFGLGDKSKWGYLGSRKVVFDEWKGGKSITQLAKAFDQAKSKIDDFILDYQLYLDALDLEWSKDEKAILLDPAVQFNPPIRFLQTSGHKLKVGISYDKTKLEVIFANAEAKEKFRHLVFKLVINPTIGLGATALYDNVFADFNPASMKVPPANSVVKSNPSRVSGEMGNLSADTSKASAGSAPGGSSSQISLKPNTLFSYPLTFRHALLRQLMLEAKELNSRKYPAAATFLLRNIVEVLLKHIIHAQKANSTGKSLDLESSLNLCQSNTVTLPVDEKKILKEFSRAHLNYLNFGAHGTVIPNTDRLMSARDCIDEFVRKNI